MKHLFLLIFLLPLILRAQTARIFEPGVISDDGIFGFTLSEDGKSSLWVQSKGKRDTMFIVESHNVGGKWQKPEVVTFSRNTGAWKDIDPIFTPGGEHVLFQSNRPVAGQQQRKGFDLWIVHKNKNGWSEPEHLGNTINTDSSESFASMTRSGNIYFTKENGSQQGDIFVSKYINGKYETPESLGPPVNTNKRDANPFISPDEDYLIFSAFKQSKPTESDLYISFKKGDGWTEPVNLGAQVNSPMFSEFCPFVHTGQDRLYFSRLQRTSSRNIENTYYIENFSALIAGMK